MRRLLLLPTLFLLGCPIDGGGGAGGGSGAAKVSGRLTIFQGAKSAPRTPSLASMIPKNQPLASYPPTSSVWSPISRADVQKLIDLKKPAPAPAATASAGPEWIAGEVIVRLEEKLTARSALELLRVPGFNVSHGGFGSEYLHLLKIANRDGTPLSIGTTKELAAQLKSVHGVRFTEVNQWQHMFAVPNDKLYSAQWHYAAMNLPAAWDITQGSASVIVADIDTGIVPHPDLDARVIPGIDMISDSTNAGDGDGRDDNPLDQGGDLPNGGSSWHGTHTAGTIGAASNNMIGVAGVDWNAKLLPVRVLGTKGGSLLDIAAGMTWATGGTVPGSRANPTPAKVVNMSLGGTSDGASQTYQDVINTANNGNAIFVIAAGNSNEDASKTIPCIQTNVICVGATRFSGKRASYSNFGAAVTVMAPGGETAEDANGDGYPDGVLSTFRDKMNQPELEFSQGTSMATPHVAGLVALMKAVNPGMSFATAKMHLTTTASTAQRCTEGCGAGMVNAQAAVLAAKGQPPSGPAKLSVNANELFFTQGAGTVTLGLSNLGATALNAMATVSGTAAANVSFPKGATVSVAGGQTGNIEVTASFTGLADGVHTASVVINSNGGQATVNVKIRVGGGSGRDAEVALAYQDTDGTWKTAATAKATAASGYAYTLDAPVGDYYVVGVLDENGNTMFDATDPVGLYPTLDSPEQLSITATSSFNNIDFPLVPDKPVKEDQGSGIGGACTTTCPNGGTCFTGYPGGYCTQECNTTSCPLGSTCIGGTNKACLSQCTGPGAGQSTCRSLYVCYDDGTGYGVCLPKCNTDADCSPDFCNMGTGYCE
jgi:serine protease